jgi:hypothetical protein
MIVLYGSTLLSSDAGDFLPMIQYKSFTFRSICFVFLSICCVHVSLESVYFEDKPLGSDKAQMVSKAIETSVGSLQLNSYHTNMCNNNGYNSLDYIIV